MVSKNREASAGRSANRLIEESSPYLLQHAHNPVDWYPWGPEALDKAAAEDRPILLSIGYSACHWCHVMESESFENESIAQLMNNNFICIKVDREERPDIDEIYMKAVQLMTGHGGWPMTVFLTPDLKPFFGGTYFPPEDRHGMPGFRRVLASVMSAWQSSREQIETSADELKAFLGKFESIAKEDVVLDRRFIDMAVEHLLRTADHQFGGFGNAPKFPFPASLELAMRIAASEKGDAAADCRRLVVNTLERMAMGGIHDQIGGGFARYSVDRQWLVPHFEKMLYDNATMSKLYFDAYRLTGRQYFRQVGLSCLAFVRRELQAEGGAFYSSLDADSEGEEGKFYVFTPDEIKAALGAEDGAWLCQVYGVHAGGNFEQGRSVLHLTDSPEELAARQGLSLDQFDARLAGLSARLLESRESRTRPSRDEKVITSWNGLMISGFVAGYKVTGDQSLLSAARAAASFMLDTMVAGDRLLRTFGQGRARLKAYLDDYAHLIQALLDLAEVDTDPRWYGRALELAQSMIERFWDSDSESFFYVSHDHERLLARPRNFYDGSTPSGTSTAARDLLRLARLSGDTRMAGLADKVISLFAPHFHKSPDQFANLICALDFSLAEPVEIAIVADDRDDSWKELMLSAHRPYLPNAVTLVTSAKSPIASPLFTGRGLADGRTAAYVCRSFTCAQPATSSEELLASLSSG